MNLRRIVYNEHLWLDQLSILKLAFIDLFLFINCQTQTMRLLSFIDLTYIIESRSHRSIKFNVFEFYKFLIRFDYMKHFIAKQLPII